MMTSRRAWYSFFSSVHSTMCLNSLCSFTYFYQEEKKEEMDGHERACLYPLALLRVC